MCYEGGCGACVVAVTLTDVDSQEKKTIAINSVCRFLQILWVVFTYEQSFQLWLPKLNISISKDVGETVPLLKKNEMVRFLRRCEKWIWQVVQTLIICKGP